MAEWYYTLSDGGNGGRLSAGEIGSGPHPVSGLNNFSLVAAGTVATNLAGEGGKSLMTAVRALEAGSLSMDSDDLKHCPKIRREVPKGRRKKTATPPMEDLPYARIS